MANAQWRGIRYKAKEMTRKYLIIQTAYIGDVILATSLIQLLRKLEPTAEIDFLLRKGNESLLQNSSDISNLYVWDKKNKYRSMFKLIKQIRARNYDRTINVQRFFNSGLFTILSGAKVKVGFDKNPLSFLFTHRIEHAIPHKIASEKFLHEVQRNAQLLRPLLKDLKIPGPKELPLKLEFSQNDREKIASITTGVENYLVIAPSSVWYTKQFPKEKWVEFLAKLPASYTVFYIGAPDDSPYIEGLRKDSPQHINLAGRISLLQSALLMEGAKRVFVNDSAPLHLASAVQAKTTAIFCSTVTDFGYFPLSPDSVVIEEKIQLDCRPCGLHGKNACPLGHFQCALSIDTNRLVSSIDIPKS